MLGLLSGWEEVSGMVGHFSPPVVRIAESYTHREPHMCLWCPECHHAKPLFSCVQNGDSSALCTHVVESREEMRLMCISTCQRLRPQWAILTMEKWGQPTLSRAPVLLESGRVHCNDKSCVST